MCTAEKGHTADFYIVRGTYPSRMASILDLPDELLDLILDEVVPLCQLEVAQSAKDTEKNMKNALQIGLTCRRFGRLTLRRLYTRCAVGFYSVEKDFLYGWRRPHFRHVEQKLNLYKQYGGAVRFGTMMGEMMAFESAPGYQKLDAPIQGLLLPLISHFRNLTVARLSWTLEFLNSDQSLGSFDGVRGLLETCLSLKVLGADINCLGSILRPDLSLLCEKRTVAFESCAHLDELEISVSEMMLKHDTPNEREFSILNRLCTLIWPSAQTVKVFKFRCGVVSSPMDRSIHIRLPEAIPESPYELTDLKTICISQPDALSIQAFGTFFSVDSSQVKVLKISSWGWDIFTDHELQLNFDFISLFPNLEVVHIVDQAAGNFSMSLDLSWATNLIERIIEERGLFTTKLLEVQYFMSIRYQPLVDLIENYFGTACDVKESASSVAQDYESITLAISIPAWLAQQNPSAANGA